MPSKKQYNLVQNDDGDTRIPLHSEEAFHHGITFQAKYIGSLDVIRPITRGEIVATMRKVRYEFKAKGIKKKKVTLEVSLDGVKVTLRKKKKKKQWIDENNIVLMQHPIYRIFYVSHDSQDLKIFSYIARDGSTDVFKCNVFKSSKKNQAMRVVRTVGQAFEVCHKLSINGPPPNPDEDDIRVETPHSESDVPDKIRKDLLTDPISIENLTANESTSTLDALSDVVVTSSSPPQHQNQRPNRLDINPKPIPPPPSSNNINSNSRRSPLSGGEVYASLLSDPLKSGSENLMPGGGTPLSNHHELQLLREQLEQQAQQTQAALAQAHLFRDRLAAETAARLESQAREHQLLVNNKELLDHIATLVALLQNQERAGIQGNQLNISNLPQGSILNDAQTPSSSSVFLSDYQDLEALRHLANQQTPLLDGRSIAPNFLPQSPPHQTMLSSMFNFGFTPTHEQQFQTQLLQRLQSLSSRPPPYPTNMFQQSALVPQSTPQPSMTPNFRISQASSYSGSPVPTHKSNSDSCIKQDDEPELIKPLSQSKTLTTTDNDGRVRLIVAVSDDESKPEPKPVAKLDPPPPGNKRNGKQQSSPTKKQQGLLASAMASLRVSGRDNEASNNRKRSNVPNGPFITRSTSEKVSNRSELMSQVQRTMWARHTTK